MTSLTCRVWKKCGYGSGGLKGRIKRQGKIRSALFNRLSTTQATNPTIYLSTMKRCSQSPDWYLLYTSHLSAAIMTLSGAPRTTRTWANPVSMRWMGVSMPPCQGMGEQQDEMGSAEPFRGLVTHVGIHCSSVLTREGHAELRPHFPPVHLALKSYLRRVGHAESRPHFPPHPIDDLNNDLPGGSTGA